MTHANAPLTPEGRRRLANLIVNRGWGIRRAAERFQCSPSTASKWASRYRQGLPLTDRTSKPLSSPRRTAQRTERRIVAVRFTRRWGPHRIAYHLHVPRSTVGRVLVRYQMPLLTQIDQASGLPVRKPKVVRYEKATPGGARSRRHQEARPHSHWRWTPHPRTAEGSTQHQARWSRIRLPPPRSGRPLQARLLRDPG